MLSHAVENAFMKVLFAAPAPVQPAMQDCELLAAPAARSVPPPAFLPSGLDCQSPFASYSPVCVTQTLKRARECESSAQFVDKPLDSAFFPTATPVASWWPSVSPNAPHEQNDEDMDCVPSPLKRPVGPS